MTNGVTIEKWDFSCQMSEFAKNYSTVTFLTQSVINNIKLLSRINKKD